MKIDINIPDDLCNDMLTQHGYTIKLIKAYYPLTFDHYGNDSPSSCGRNLTSVEIKIAFIEAPEEITKEFPLLNNLTQYLYENVVNELFNSILFEMLKNNKN